MESQSTVPAKDSTEIKQPPIRFEHTQLLIERLESRLNGSFISYWNNTRGSVCQSDVIAMFSLLESMGRKDTIFLFIKSDGGHGCASLRLVNLLRRHCSHLVALIPLECASAATMIALGADEIQMGPMAYLTAVDSSLTHDLSPIDRDNDRVSVSLDELKRVIWLWRGEKLEQGMNPYHALFQHVHPLVIGAVDRADSLSLMLCKEILSYHISDASRAAAIAEALNSNYPSHSYPVLLNEAKRIGLNATSLDADVNSMLLDLNEQYSEMGQKATTDFSEIRSHSNEIVNIIERKGQQVYFQNDKDWFYRSEERRWITMNDHSSWRRIETQDGQMLKSILHIA